jgi:hypothetical protein
MLAAREPYHRFCTLLTHIISPVLSVASKASV